MRPNQALEPIGGVKLLYKDIHPRGALEGKIQVGLTSIGGK